MNIGDLSDLAYVLEQVKNVLNTSGARHQKTKIHELKRRMDRLEEQFVDGVLDFDMSEFNEEEDLQKTVMEAKKKAGLPVAPDPRTLVASRNIVKRGDAVVVEPSEDQEPTQALVPNEVTEEFVDKFSGKPAPAKKKPKAEKPASFADDNEFRAKLAAAKKAVAEKKKKAE